MAVEGDFKHFKIKLVEESDIPKILEYLTNEFHFIEPITKYLPRDYEYVNLINLKIGEKLRTNEHLSLIAVDKTTGEIAATQLQFLWTKSEADAERRLKLTKEQSGDKLPSTFLLRKVMDAIYAPMENVKLGIFDKFGVSQVAWNFLVSTGEKYRNQGLASELYQRMVILLRRDERFKLIFGVYSSPFSRRCAEKVGFIELAKSYYGQAKDEDGKLVLPSATGAEDFSSIMVLQL